MKYRIDVTPAAGRSLDRLPILDRLAVRGVIVALTDDPRPRGATKLVGMRNLWRLRVRIDGKRWRVLYRIDDARQLVIVTRVVRRDEGTYRGL